MEMYTNGTFNQLNISTLNQAIAAAGGLRNLNGKIEFIRLKKVEKVKIVNNAFNLGEHLDV